LNDSEDMKRFYSRLVSSQLDPHIKMLSFCDNKYFSSSWKDDTLSFISIDLKSFYIQSTDGEVNDSDRSTRHRSDLDELLGISTVSMDFDLEVLLHLRSPCNVVDKRSLLITSC
jgi:hypothetical protein